MMKRVDVAYVLLYDHKQENILVVKNRSVNGSYYTLPGGAVENGETLQDAAIREVREETGLDIKINGLLAVSEAFFKERGHHAIFFTFAGEIAGGTTTISLPDEIEEIKWMDADRAKKYAYVPSEIGDVIKSANSIPYILKGKAIQRI